MINNNQDNKLLETAQEYRKKGFSVIPIGINPEGGQFKLPLIGWSDLKRERSSEEQIKNWFEPSFGKRVTGLGIVTGENSGITVIDLDLDKKTGKLNEEFIEKLKGVKTPVAKSGSGGYHYYFRYYPKFKNKAKIAPNVDIRTEGGCIIAPPSKHLSGGRYEWVVGLDTPIAIMPDWLKDFAKEEKPIVARERRGTNMDRRIDEAKAVPFNELIPEFGKRNPIQCLWHQEKHPSLSWDKKTNRIKCFGCPISFDTIAYIEDIENIGFVEAVKTLTPTYVSGIPLPVAPADMANLPQEKEGAGKVFTKIGQAQAYIAKQPMYYSPEGLIWFWNFEKYCYELKDEIDLLNGIRKEMEIDTVNGKTRVEILSALKQVGREQRIEDKPKRWVQFKDTLIDPKTLKKMPATPKYFLTNPIPHKLGESEETPEIDRLLHEWAVKEGVQDESYVQSLYEYIAYSLTDDLFMQRIIALTGGGSNGKGKFLTLIRRLVGMENVVEVDLKGLSNYQDTFATSRLYKKLVAFAGEVDYRDLKNTKMLKKLAGEDLLAYTFKGKNTFTDKCMATLYIATNSLPATPDKSLGFYRRWAITDFPNTFDIKDGILDVISEEEYENLCLKSVGILKGLYGTKRFTNEGTYDEREKKYEARSNPLPTFIEDCCEEIPGEKVKLRQFGTAFNKWLKSKSLRMMDIRQVGKMLRNEGYELGSRKYFSKDGGETSAISIKGIVLKGVADENEENALNEAYKAREMLENAEEAEKGKKASADQKAGAQQQF